MTKQIALVYHPTVEIIASMALDELGIFKMIDWVKEHRPDCTPAGGYSSVEDLVPHGLWEEVPGNVIGEAGTRRRITDNELLVELAGRKCYDSFAEKGKPATNSEYIKNTQAGDVPHASILYHAKISFFIAGVSRRVSHELIRNYVGADRDEEGSPSQESTRFTHHYGFYIPPPRILNSPRGLEQFVVAMQNNYDEYLKYIEEEINQYRYIQGQDPKGTDRKQIYEAASSFLSHSCETSFIWTTNPMALRKLWKERCHKGADAEFQRFSNLWKATTLARFPNLFPGVE